VASITEYFRSLINTHNNTNKNAGSGIIVWEASEALILRILVFTKELIVIMGL
jgi:hypothetical protein